MVLQPGPAWGNLLAALITFLESDTPLKAIDDEAQESLQEMMTYSSEFSKLQNAKLPAPPVLPEVCRCHW